MQLVTLLLCLVFVVIIVCAVSNVSNVLSRAEKGGDSDSDYIQFSSDDEEHYDSDKDPSWCPGEGVSIPYCEWSAKTHWWMRNNYCVLR